MNYIEIWFKMFICNKCEVRGPDLGRLDKKLCVPVINGAQRWDDQELEQQLHGQQQKAGRARSVTVSE